MNTHATATFEIKSWDEKPFSEIDGGGKLTHASVTKAFHGEIEGEGKLEYLMIYHTNGATDFFGLERVVGRIGDRSGSFVLQHSGTDEDGETKATCSVAPGSGTEDLRGLRGVGGFVATRDNYTQVPFTLDYEFE